MGVHDDAEAWIVALGPNETMFTGGDDSTFCLWDLKSHETIVRKKFMCGQTSCEWSPVNENIIAQRLAQLIENKKLRQEMGKKAFAQSLNFGVDTMIKDYIKLYKEVYDG